QVRLPDAAKDELGQKRGLLIVSVESSSPAENGGLTLGDTIVGLGSNTVQNHNDLLSALNSNAVDNEVSIKILRGGQVQTVSVTLGERPA
ncbi:MAG: PDZ domain-containing protein, partial [Chloroflexi bacterium]|nr:PDZ domain-containing protein [Chloroflexota bacterium]